MRYSLPVCFSLAFATALAQPLRDINFAYLYDPAEAFSFGLQVSRGAAEWTIAYGLQLRDTSIAIDDFTISWETRESLSDGRNTPLDSAVQVDRADISATGIYGFFAVPLESAPRIVVAKVTRLSLKQAWIFYRILDPAYPADVAVKVNNEFVTGSFVSTSDEVRLYRTDAAIVSYYNDEFPPALPPFAERAGRVAPGIKADSTFVLRADDRVILARRGLYLLQKDTSAAGGFAFRVENDYPRPATIPGLVGPMIYICTRQEYDRLILAKNEKKIFDRVVLGITSDAERARKLIRSYYRRVEAANRYFTSYKQGWKTDRGMVLIIYGTPQSVFKFDDREVWTYDDAGKDLTFNFTKSSTVFDPENYVLVRDEKYQTGWHERFNLWRNARF